MRISDWSSDVCSSDLADCRRGVLAIDGMMDALEEAVQTGGKPFLGICVGMQLMATCGLEYGTTPGFGWIPGAVAPLQPGPTAQGALKVPHLGWNATTLRARNLSLLAGFGNNRGGSNGDR